MTYKSSHLAGFFLAAGMLTAASLWGFVHGVEPLLPQARAVHALLFRTPIQFATLGVCCFALLVLAHRFIYQICFVRPGIRHLAYNHSLRGVARLVWQRYDKVRACKESDGVAAAAGYNKELAERDAEELGRIYQLVGHSTQLMLALGFFGTVWGISQKLFGGGAFDTALGTTSDGSSPLGFRLSYFESTG
jgi:hypothetical protein